ncbi:MAG: hypothetical protein ACI8ZB_004183 [Desulforhopalus sp.]
MLQGSSVGKYGIKTRRIGMKKIIASTVGLMILGGAGSAFAVEHEFGGYWRTRLFVQDEMNDDGSYSRIDNRTRLYYTAKFDENFKFVNKFEFNSTWGDDEGGDIGADGDTFVIKNSYADFTLGSVNTKLGIQSALLARGFLFDADFSGVVVTPQFGNISLPVGYIAVQSEDGGDADFDEAIGFIKGDIKVNDNMSVAPYFAYWDASVGTDNDDLEVGDYSTYYLGADFDLKLDVGSLWGTFIYNGGEYEGGDVNGFLVAAGANMGIAHGQAFYATGDDDDSDDDTDAFLSSPGQSYYWSEIMGLGIFDNTASSSSCGDAISNVAALNGGITLVPMDKMTLTGDVWYAMLAEEDDDGEDELGLEFNGKLSYALMDNLTADFVLAYLVAGDATGDATGDDDIFEGGVRLSLKF